MSPNPYVAQRHFASFEVDLLHLRTSRPYFNPTWAERHRQDRLILHQHPRLNVKFRRFEFNSHDSHYSRSKMNLMLYTGRRMPEIWTEQRKFSQEPVFARTDNCHPGQHLIPPCSTS